MALGGAVQGISTLTRRRQCERRQHRPATPRGEPFERSVKEETVRGAVPRRPGVSIKGPDAGCCQVRRDQITSWQIRLRAGRSDYELADEITSWQIRLRAGRSDYELADQLHLDAVIAASLADAPPTRKSLPQLRARRSDYDLGAAIAASLSRWSPQLDRWGALSAGATSVYVHRRTRTSVE